MLQQWLVAVARSSDAILDSTLAGAVKYAEFKDVSQLYVPSLLHNMKLMNVLSAFGQSAIKF